MPKRLPADLDEQLLKHIGNAPGGASIDDLLRLLNGETSRRSLQRRLSELVDANRLSTEGGGRSTRYLVPEAISEAEIVENYVRLSPSGADVRQLVRRPSPLSFIDVPERAYVEGLLGVYELNRVDLLRDVFVWAYERSAQRYVAVRQSLGEPDKFRLKFRNELTDVVGEIVRGGLSPTVEEVTKAARERVPAEHLDDFVRMTTKDLENLHEGNFARFRIRPSEYHAWRNALSKGSIAAIAKRH